MDEKTIEQVVAWVMTKATAILNAIGIAVKRHDFTSIISAIGIIVSVVEQAGAEFKELHGEDKMKVAATVLNRIIDIPMIPESVEQWVFESLIQFAVDNLNYFEWANIKLPEVNA